MLVTIIIIAIIAYIAYGYILAKPKEKVEGLQDKYVLITGCDSGFGRLLTENLSKQNVHVFAACLTQDAVQELNQTFPNVHAFILDITKAEQVQQAYQFVIQTLPKDVGLWGVVNNAGILINGFIDWLSMEDYSRVIDVNLYGTIRITNQFLPLVKQAKGRIINISSILGVACPRYFAPYSASKAAIIAFSNTLRREMKAFDISVSCLCPGLFRTALSDAAQIPARLRQQQDKLNQDLQKVYDQAFFTQCKSIFKYNHLKLIYYLTPFCRTVYYSY